MSGTFNDRGQIEPTAAAIIFCTGKKGSGKSVMGMVFASSWPNDMVVIDVARDDGPLPRPANAVTGVQAGTHDVIDIRGTVEDLPRAWPEHLRREGPGGAKRPMILHYLPDAGSPTELEDMDTMVGLAFNHSTKDRPCMVVIHEVGRAAPANRTPANMRRVLNHNRHEGLTAVFCGPRPLTIDPLVKQQADLVYVFELKNWRDRKDLAENIGWDVDEFDAAVLALGPHEYLRYDGREPPPEHPDDEDPRLISFPALPEDVVADVERWKTGGPAVPR